jgi:hypothetical protein
MASKGVDCQVRLLHPISCKWTAGANRDIRFTAP